MRPLPLFSIVVTGGDHAASPNWLAESIFVLLAARFHIQIAGCFHPVLVHFDGKGANESQATGRIVKMRTIRICLLISSMIRSGILVDFRFL